MRCPRCRSENVNVQIVQTDSKTTHRKRGCLWGMFRIFLIICTCGLWLVGEMMVGKFLFKSKTKFKNKTRAVCQKCGHMWKP